MCENQSSVINDGIVAIESGVSCIRDLCALFDAIKAAYPEDTNERNIARIGGNLAEEWGYMCEMEVNKVKGMQENKLSEFDGLSEVANLIDAISLCSSSISDLAALFIAIRDASNKHTTASDLAGIGGYMADRGSNDLDRIGDNIKGVFDETQKLGGKGYISGKLETINRVH